MPDPRRIERPDRFASQIDCEWSELVGVVRQVQLVDSSTCKSMSWTTTTGQSVPPVPSTEALAELTGLVDAEVRVLGVGGVDENGDRGGVSVKLFVQSADSVQVISRPASTPLRATAAFWRAARSGEDDCIEPSRSFARRRDLSFPSGEMVVQDEGERFVFTLGL